MTIASLLTPTPTLDQQTLDRRPSLTVVATRAAALKREPHITTDDTSAAGLIGTWVVDIASALDAAAAPLLDATNATIINATTSTQGVPVLPDGRSCRSPRRSPPRRLSSKREPCASGSLGSD